MTNTLLYEIPHRTMAVNPQKVIHAGPFDLYSLALSSSVLDALRTAYSIAISHIFILATTFVVVSIPFVCGMRWINLNHISKERELAKSENTAKRETESVQETR